MKRAVAALVVLALSGTARADPETDLGLNPRTAALAGAVGATGGDFTASAHNPGALVVPGDEAGFGELSVSFATVAPAVWTNGLDDDVSAAIAPPNTYALVAGGRFDVGAGLGLPGLALGFAFYAPLEGLVRSRIRPDDALQWLALTDRTQHVALNAALAYQIVEWLSIGVGVRVTFDEEAFITGSAEGVERVVDPETGEERVVAGATLGVDTAIYGHAAPVIGVLVAPLPELRFGFAWRGRLFSDDWGWSRLQGIEGVGDIGFIHRFTHVYRPHELAWSAAWRAHPAFEASAELTWAMWSDARTPTFDRPAGRFGDVLIPALGVRVTPTPGFDLLGGYRYAARYYDDLGGPTNLMLNDAHTVGLGVEADLDRLIRDEDVPFTVSLAARLSILEDREEMKNGRRFDSDRALRENPGYPGYRYGGVVPSVQLGVEMLW